MCSDILFLQMPLHQHVQEQIQTQSRANMNEQIPSAALAYFLQENMNVMAD